MDLAGEWVTVRVSEVASLVVGGTPKRDTRGYWNGNVPWATARDVVAARGRYLVNVQETITVEGLRNSAAKLMPKGSVVITARGTVGALTQLGSDMAFNQTCYAVVPRECLDNVGWLETTR